MAYVLHYIRTGGLINVLLINGGVLFYADELQNIRVLDKVLGLARGFFGKNLFADGFLVPARQQPLIKEGIDLPFQLADTPTGFGTFLFVECPRRLVFYACKKTIMGPCQLVTHCVTNLEKAVHLPST